MTSAQWRVRTPWSYSWNLVAIALLVQTVIFGVAVQSFSFWVADWMADFHARRGPVIVASTLVIVISALMSPVSGRLADRWSVRGTMLVGIGCFVAGFAMLSLSVTLWQMIIIYGVMMGVAVAFAGPIVSQALVARSFEAHRGLAIGITVTGASLGGIVMPPLVTWLLLRLNWREAALVIAAIGLALMPIASAVIRKPPVAPQMSGHRSPTPDLSSEEMRSDQAPKAVLLQGNFWVLVAVFLPIYAAEMVLLSNFKPLTADSDWARRRRPCFFRS